MRKVKFVHASDIHVGGFAGGALRVKEAEALTTFVNRCIDEKADFVVLAGDTFDSNIPPIRESIMCAKEMRMLNEAGRRVYAVYGSQDYSPTKASLFELHLAAG